MRARNQWLQLKCYQFVNQMHVLTGILKNKTEHRTTNKPKYLKEQKAEISALLMIELSWDLYIDWKTRLLCQVHELWAQSAEAQSTSPPNGIAADTARLWEQACRWTRVWMCSTDMSLITAWVHVLTALNCCCNEQLTCCWSLQLGWLCLQPQKKGRLDALGLCAEVWMGFLSLRSRVSLFLAGRCGSHLESGDL